MHRYIQNDNIHPRGQFRRGRNKRQSYGKIYEIDRVDFYVPQKRVQNVKYLKKKKSN